MAKNKRKVRRAKPPEVAVRAKEQEPAQKPAPKAKDAPRKSGQFQDVDAVLAADAIPYFFWREWWRAKDRGDFEFIYELSADGSALREHFGPADAFSEVCRRKMRPVLGTNQGNLAKVRLHTDDEAYLIQTIGTDERGRHEYTAERWFLLRGAKGWRAHQIDEISVSKERDPATLTLDDFPSVSFPEGATPANG